MYINAIGNSSQFTTRLIHPIDFKVEKYEVALLCCFWPNRVNNVRPCTFTHMIGEQMYEGTTFGFSGGYFKSIGELLDSINFELNKHFFRAKNIEFKENVRNPATQYKFRFELDYTGRVRFSVSDSGIQTYVVNLGVELLAKLGFTESVTMQNSLATLYPNLNSGLETLFLYCDLMKPSRAVGQQMLQVLKILPVNQNNEDIAFYEPKHIEFFDICRNQISSISFEFRDTLGRLVDFKGGEIHIELYLKKKGF